MPVGYRAGVRPFRFAAIAVHGATAREWREKAREAEALGYDVLLITDHITTQLAPLPALVAAADATTRLRIGSFVFDNDYRNPVMLAKEAATVDLLSDGRLEFGLGAGWNARDYTQLGIVYDTPKVRVDRFAEALALTKRLWTARGRPPSSGAASASADHGRRRRTPDAGYRGAGGGHRRVRARVEARRP